MCLMAVDADFGRETVAARVYITILPEESGNAFFNGHCASPLRGYCSI